MKPDYFVGQTTDREMGRLQGQVERLLCDLDKALEMLLGDGQPGVLERLTRTEENVESVVQMVEHNALAIEKLAKVEEDMSTSVALHLADKTNHSPRMLLEKKTIATLVGGFIMLYLFLENIVNIPTWTIQLLTLIGLGL